MRKSTIYNIRWPLVVVVFFVLLYCAYFTFASLGRGYQLWTSYFDLGIMHQTAYSSYLAIKNLDPSTFLTLTDPHGSGMVVSRLAIHFDPMLGLLALLYFIHPGPETLLVVQTLVLASGALALHLIVKKSNFKSRNISDATSFIVPLLYLAYYPLQLSNLYDFHAVTLTTALVLWYYYFFITKRRKLQILFLALCFMCKEQVGFGFAIWFALPPARDFFANAYKMPLSKLVRSGEGLPATFSSGVGLFNKSLTKNRKSLLAAAASFCFVLSLVFVVMPYFRQGDDHFALEYFAKSGAGDGGPVLRMFTHGPKYIFDILSPLLFLPILSMSFLPAIADIMINITSSSNNMRNTYYHYTAFITPWLFLGLVEFFAKYNLKKNVFIAITLLLGATAVYKSFYFAPLPHSARHINQIFGAPNSNYQDTLLWSRILADPQISVSTTGQLAPLFAGRRVFMSFGDKSFGSQYILLRKIEIFDYPEKEVLVPLYARLTQDKSYKRIFANGDFEVFKKVFP